MRGVREPRARDPQPGGTWCCRGAAVVLPWWVQEQKQTPGWVNHGGGPCSGYFSKLWWSGISWLMPSVSILGARRVLQAPPLQASTLLIHSSGAETPGCDRPLASVAGREPELGSLIPPWRLTPTSDPARRWTETPAGPRRSRGVPGGSSQPGALPAEVPASPAASAGAAQHMCLKRRLSQELLGNAREVTARLAGRHQTSPPHPQHASGLASEGRGADPGLRGWQALGAALTSWTMLPQAALPRLQQLRAGSPLLPGSPQNLPRPRLHTPLAAAGLALVGAGAPLAPRPQLARLCGGQGGHNGDSDHAGLGASQGSRDVGCGWVLLTLALAGAGLRRGAGGALPEALALVQVKLVFALHAEVSAEAALAAGRPALCGEQSPSAG